MGGVKGDLIPFGELRDHTSQRSHRSNGVARRSVLIATWVLEGILTKQSTRVYITDARRGTWIKIKNPRYTQAEGRHELFDECG